MVRPNIPIWCEAYGEEWNKIDGILKISYLRWSKLWHAFWRILYNTLIPFWESSERINKPTLKIIYSRNDATTTNMIGGHRAANGVTRNSQAKCQYKTSLCQKQSTTITKWPPNLRPFRKFAKVPFTTITNENNGRSNGPNYWIQLESDNSKDVNHPKDRKLTNHAETSRGTE